MTKPYDRNDNDTYVELFSQSPAQDVEYHMYRDDSGTDGHGRMRGKYSEETGKTAANKVLRSPTATETGLVLIKAMNQKTLYPLSLVKRYSIKAESLTYTQKMNVFFDIKKEMFVLMMDHRFVRDLGVPTVNQLISAGPKGRTEIYTGKDKKPYLGLTYHSMEDMKKDEGGLLTHLLEAYRGFW